MYTVLVAGKQQGSRNREADQPSFDKIHKWG